ncbi:hypothetical protein AVEN_128777-1, partial [Araneus ventricosus]
PWRRSGKVSALGPKVPDSKPDSTEESSCMCIKSVVVCQPFSRWCGVEVWRGGASSDVSLVI